MACGAKEYRAHAETCLRRAHTVRNPILAEEFEKIAHSWLRLAKAAEQSGWAAQRPTDSRYCRRSTVPRC
jgi:hypothetical protein